MVVTAVIAQFLGGHPKAEAALKKAKVDVALAEESPCGEADQNGPAARVAEVSPDGKRVAILASWHEGPRQLAKAHLIVLDDRGATVFALKSFPGCDIGDKVAWSADSQHVMARHVDGNGARIAVVDGTKLVFDVLAPPDE